MSQLKRVVSFTPAFDKRDPEPSKNYGIGSVTCRFLLKGELGIIQFYFSTGQYLPHVQEELHPKEAHLSNGMGYDVGYHSPKPSYAGQPEMDCDLLEGGRCYYDGSSLRADEWYKIFVAKGDEAIWKLMEEDYAERFEL